MKTRITILTMMVVFLMSTAVVFADDVFVTTVGTKYHKESCRLIKNKDNMTKMDKTLAFEEGYAPCRRCFKEDLKDEDQLSRSEGQEIKSEVKK